MNIMRIYGRSDFMFKKLTTEEQLQKEREKNMILLNKQTDLENALFELAEMFSEKAEMFSEKEVNE